MSMSMSSYILCPCLHHCQCLWLSMSVSLCLCLCLRLCLYLSVFVYAHVYVNVQVYVYVNIFFFAYSLYKRATRGKIHLPERATTRNANFTKIAKFTKIHYGVIFAGKIHSSCWALLDISFEVLCCLANFPSFPKFRRRVQTWTYVARLVKKRLLIL